MLMTDIPTIKLNNGLKMPQFGLGVWRIPPEEAADNVQAAIAAGYRLIDTAAIYGNEAGVGEGVRKSGVPRERLFVTSKLWNSDQGHDSTMKAFEASLDRLGLDYLDLYLIHWPTPMYDTYVESWKAMEKLQAEGRVKAIGVSNFQPAHLERLAAECEVVPAVNQVELRWHIQLGLVVIPRSSKVERIRENADIFDFELEAADVAAISALNRDERLGAHPDAMDKR
jgi:2,5-diketo-D-gluconate reductase A